MAWLRRPKTAQLPARRRPDGLLELGQHGRVRCFPRHPGQVDVLLMFGPPPTSGWWETRGRMVIELLQEAGISAACVALPDRRIGPVRALHERLRPRLSVNRAFTVGSDVMAELAGQYADCRFVSVCHSSQSDLARVSAWIGAQSAHAANARQHRNLFYAHVDERNHLGQLTQHERFLWLPNVVRVPAPGARLDARGTVTVSLVCAARVLKNLPNQVVALGLAARQLPLKILYCIDGPERDEIRSLSDLAGLDYEFAQWGDWASYIELIRSRVHVGFQASFTESFNYVGIEHMLCGRPVIGSPALRYLPSRWMANPDSPEDLASRLLQVVRHYRRESRRARRVASKLAVRLNREFVTAVETLLNPLSPRGNRQQPTARFMQRWWHHAAASATDRTTSHSMEPDAEAGGAA